MIDLIIQNIYVFFWKERILYMTYIFFWKCAHADQTQRRRGCPSSLETRHTKTHAHLHTHARTPTHTGLSTRCDTSVAITWIERWRAASQPRALPPSHWLVRVFFSVASSPFYHAHASNAKSPTPYIPNETCRGTLPEQGLFLWQTRSSLRAEDKWYLVALGLPFEKALERVERHASGFPPQTRGSTQTEQGLFSLGHSHRPLLFPLSPLLRPPPSILLGLYASRRFKHSSDKTACCL